MKVCAVLIGACVASGLIFSPVFAASPLPAGKPAGVKQAQWNDTYLPIALGVVAIAGIAIAASQQGQATVAASTNTNP